VRIIVGFAAGGTPDIVARVVGQWLSERLGQQVVVENRTGAGGNIAVETVVNAPGDGYTLLLVPTAAAINATLYDNLNFNFIRDIAPVAGVTRIPNIMLVNPSLPVHSVAEFITYAKANPGRVNMASAGVGSGPHLAGELFKVMAGVDMVHVPYRGGPPALKDLIAGQVQVLFINGSVNEDIRAGRLRALAVTSATRSAEFPGVRQ
jgi:tripartite-type tricarboxylate transporter receptor subunit TctC